LALALEGQDGLGQLVAVDTCGDDREYHSPVDIHQGRRRGFSPERVPRQLPDPSLAGYAKNQVFRATADAVNGTGQRQQLSGGGSGMVRCTQQPPAMLSPVPRWPQ
jgi:hypothetical protein